MGRNGATCIKRAMATTTSTITQSLAGHDPAPQRKTTAMAMVDDDDLCLFFFPFFSFHLLMFFFYIAFNDAGIFITTFDTSSLLLYHQLMPMPVNQQALTRMPPTQLVDGHDTPPMDDDSRRQQQTTSLSFSALSNMFNLSIPMVKPISPISKVSSIISVLLI
jgi:hypothetical protein